MNKTKGLARLAGIVAAMATSYSLTGCYSDPAQQRRAEERLVTLGLITSDKPQVATLGAAMNRLNNSNETTVNIYNQDNNRNSWLEQPKEGVDYIMVWDREAQGYRMQWIK